ncbi:MAG TPA: GGDEF domain-containing protein [Burkholderiaceae bacterium]|nr:GGDEF domain-containing protein [Burkholderiaceae bacterium]
MTELVDRLADLTAQRDRDVLDVTLAGALHDLLAPHWVGVHRVVGEAGAERWATRARMAAGDVAPSAESALAEFEQLPRLDGRPAWCDCLRGSQVITLEGPPATTLFALATDAGAIGVLELRTERALLPSERRTVASILRICRNFESLLDYSERDTLTGLLNRKTFDDAFLKVALPAAPTAAPSTPAERRQTGAAAHYLGLIDIDHFKRVNDGFGHLIGDEVLLLLARLMRATFRYHDRLYRFGGEEFVVLLRCGDETSALAAFERLRGNVARYAFPQVGTITVSVGITAIRAQDTPSAAFERADRAVYFAKGHGRDQVRSHEALVDAGELAEGAQRGDVELF